MWGSDMQGRREEHGFTAVDAQAEPLAWAGVLDRLHGETFYQGYKRRVAELLAPRSGGIYVEVGAGTGDDARAVSEAAGATVVACDLSRVLAGEARRRGAACVAICDGMHLPFANDAFDGAWADRTLQHVQDPETVLREIVRVVRPGGRIVTVDPDYDTQVMEFPDRDLARRVLRLRAERGLRNGTLAHRVPGLLGALGMSEVRVEGATLIARDPAAYDNVMGLRTWARTWQEDGELFLRDVERWESLFDEVVAGGRFFYSVTLFTTLAVKPYHI